MINSKFEHTINCKFRGECNEVNVVATGGLILCWSSVNQEPGRQELTMNCEAWGEGSKEGDVASGLKFAVKCKRLGNTRSGFGIFCCVVVGWLVVAGVLMRVRLNLRGSVI